MIIERFEPWMKDKKVRLVDAAYNRGGDKMSPAYEPLVGQCGTLMGRVRNEKQGELIAVRGISIEHDIFYSWRFELVGSNPLPLPG